MVEKYSKRKSFVNNQPTDKKRVNCAVPFNFHTSSFLDSVIIDNFKKGNVKYLKKIWDELPASFLMSHEAVKSCYYEYLSNSKLYESFKFICSQNIDLNQRTFMGSGFLEEAVFHDNIKAAKLLIESGADINVLHVPYKDTPVFHINSRNMLTILREYNADFNIIDSEGDTVLHSLIQKNTHIEIIKDIIEKTSFNLLNHVNNNFHSILDCAIINGQFCEKQLDTMIYLYQLNVPYNKEKLNSYSWESSVMFQKHILSNSSIEPDIKLNKYRI